MIGVRASKPPLMDAVDGRMGWPLCATMDAALHSSYLLLSSGSLRAPALSYSLLHKRRDS